MASILPLFDEDMNIIQKLGDTPGTDNNLDWKQLQAEFDKAGNLLKSYLNMIIPKINTTLGGEGNFISGGKMIGDIDANGNRLYGLVEPSMDSEAATKRYVDYSAITRMPLSGGTMYGNINMGGNAIQNLGTPVYGSDAVTKDYVDSKKLFFTDVAVPASAWKTASASDTDNVRTNYANIALTGVLASMTPQVAFWPNHIDTYGLSPLAKCFDGVVQIYADSAPTDTIIIPTIICWR